MKKLAITVLALLALTACTEKKTYEEPVVVRNYVSIVDTGENGKGSLEVALDKDGLRDHLRALEVDNELAEEYIASIDLTYDNEGQLFNIEDLVVKVTDSPELREQLGVEVSIEDIPHKVKNLEGEVVLEEDNIFDIRVDEDYNVLPLTRIHDLITYEVEKTDDGYKITAKLPEGFKYDGELTQTVVTHEVNPAVGSKQNENKESTGGTAKQETPKKEESKDVTAKPDTSFGIKVSKKDFTKPNGPINSKWIVENLQILFDNNAIINLTGHRVLEITDANISETQKLEGATANFIRYSAKRVSEEYNIEGTSVGDVVHGSVLVIQEDSGALWTRGGHTFHGPYIDNMVSQDAQMSGMTYIVERYMYE